MPYWVYILQNETTGKLIAPLPNEKNSYSPRNMIIIRAVTRKMITKRSTTQKLDFLRGRQI